jgi:hypothetical protein
VRSISCGKRRRGKGRRGCKGPTTKHTKRRNDRKMIDRKMGKEKAIHLLVVHLRGKWLGHPASTRSTMLRTVPVAARQGQNSRSNFMLAHESRFHANSCPPHCCANSYNPKEWKPLSYPQFLDRYIHPIVKTNLTIRCIKRPPKRKMASFWAKRAKSPIGVVATLTLTQTPVPLQSPPPHALGSLSP